MNWSIIYRGPLSSCNYDCSYCPFGKTKNTRAELVDDAQKLSRFVDWVEGRSEQIGILMTPWGEGLIRSYYQKAMTRLSHFKNVERIAIQTNLSCGLKWMEKVNRESFALWTTFHPTQTSLEAFVEKCRILDEMGIRYSVGMVGLKEDLGLIEKMREQLSPKTYFWVNAYKRVENYYTEEELNRLQAIDPLFSYNNKRHPSMGKACRAGSSSFTVDGEGNMRSCHFISNIIGNIYEPNFEQALLPKNCINDSCGCHIGYVNLEELKLEEKFGNNFLERIALPHSFG
jgi:MoaA/NifB/PqqE/SkfB family radical SAM enzyme